MKRKLVTGPLGLKLTDDQAKSLDALLKTLPKECQTIKRKGVVASTELVKGERSDISWITTDSVDRDNEVVVPEGIDLEHYKKNPIVLWGHDDTKPIGKAIWIKHEGQGLKAKTQYATRPNNHTGDWIPDTVFALVQQGILKGRSIGFLPLEYAPPTEEHIKARPEWKNARAIIPRSLMYEYSVVSVPANQDALVEAVSKGFRRELTTLGIELPQPKRIDTVKNVLKALDNINPDEIVEKVIANIRNRGRI